MYGLIFANGDLNDGPAVQAALHGQGFTLIIAADGGLRHVQALGLVPHIVVGDMDSVDPAALAQVKQQGAEIHRAPVDKDETDLELALREAALQHCDPICIFAALGGRLDQELGNVYLLGLPELRNRDVKLISGRQTAWLAYPGDHTISGQPGDTLSLLPLSSEAVGIVTDRLKYPLRDETLFFGPARGMSNVLLENEARVTFNSGILLMIHTIGHA